MARPSAKRTYSIYLDDAENVAVNRIAAANHATANAVCRALIRRALGLPAERPCDTFTGDRVPTPTRICDMVAIQRGTDRPNDVVIIQGHIDSRVTDVMNFTADAPGANQSQGGVVDLSAAEEQGGWSLSGIATIQTGNPVNVTITPDQANTGQTSQRPNRIGPIHASDCGKVLIACVNSNAFALPTQYTYGNSARNPFYGPGYVNLDSSLAKTFRFHERLAFQFRIDAYNTFNHVNLSNPDSCVDCGTAGRITDILGNANMREWQFGLRIEF